MGIDGGLVDRCISFVCNLMEGGAGGGVDEKKMRNDDERKPTSHLERKKPFHQPER